MAEPPTSNTWFRSKVTFLSVLMVAKTSRAAGILLRICNAERAESSNVAGAEAEAAKLLRLMSSYCKFVFDKPIFWSNMYI